MIDAIVSTCTTHRSSSVSFCRPLWVTPSRSSSSWRTRSVASVSLLLTSSLSSDRPCDERSSSCGTEKQLWVLVTAAIANHSRWISGLSSREENECWTESGAYVILMIYHRWEDLTGCGMFTYAFLFHVLPTLYLTRMTTTSKPKQITSSTAVMKV